MPLFPIIWYIQWYIGYQIISTILRENYWNRHEYLMPAWIPNRLRPTYKLVFHSYLISSFPTNINLTTFSWLPLSVYRDLLAISATSKLFVWVVEHKLGSIAGKLATFLINTFGFSRLILDNDADERMDVDVSSFLSITDYEVLRLHVWSLTIYW